MFSRGPNPAELSSNHRLWRFEPTMNRPYASQLQPCCFSSSSATCIMYNIDFHQALKAVHTKVVCYINAALKLVYRGSCLLIAPCCYSHHSIRSLSGRESSHVVPAGVIYLFRLSVLNAMKNLLVRTLGYLDRVIVTIQSFPVVNTPVIKPVLSGQGYKVHTQIKTHRKSNRQLRVILCLQLTADN